MWLKLVDILPLLFAPKFNEVAGDDTGEDEEEGEDILGSGEEKLLVLDDTEDGLWTVSRGR
jgi:hypothetical protein